MHLQYHDLTIRDALPSDAPQLVLWWNDGAVMAHAGFPLGLGTTIEKEAARLPAPGRLMLEYRGRPIGEMSWRDAENAAEIGIKICDGTACHVRKSIPILEHFRKELGLTNEKHTSDDGLFTVETVSCLGACGLAPAIVVNDHVHPTMTVEKAQAIIDELRGEENA